jgi:hypothetical protein
MNVFLALHNETPGDPGFTGVTPQERAAAAGYEGFVGETANQGKMHPIDDNYEWFHSIFHRRPYIDHRVTEVGYSYFHNPGNRLGSCGIGKWGYETDATQSSYSAFPAPGQTLVPFSWSAFEAPEPFPRRNRSTGPPITISYSNPKYREYMIQLLDPEGKPVPLITSRTRPEPETFIEVLPDKPLLPGTKYTLEFSYTGGNDSWQFTTAPLNPSEIMLRDISQLMLVSTDLLPRIDIAQAMKRNGMKGELGIEKTEGGERLTDEKYRFSFTIPDGWSIHRERDWEEVRLTKEGANIYIYVYLLGAERTPELVYNTLSKDVTYPLARKSSFSAPHLTGYKGEYEWEYQGEHVVYYGVFGNFGVGIYGYGVAPEDLAGIVESLRRLP